MAFFYDVKYKMKPGMRDEFIKGVKELGVVSKSRHEDGNGKYEYVIPKEDKELLLLYEIWETLEAHTAHCETEHFKKLTELKGKYLADSEIKVIEINVDNELNG